MEAIKEGMTEEDGGVLLKRPGHSLETVDDVIGKPSRPADDLDFTGVKFGVLPQYLAEEFKVGWWSINPNHVCLIFTPTYKIFGRSSTGRGMRGGKPYVDIGVVGICSVSARAQ
uniref:Uncharacterized protein n=1 Tax=Timema douglasi TaxID=61478 RepID=A0A7R8VPE5_TIMDO|nr:unnamed protein product [Timema douglasi]